MKHFLLFLFLFAATPALAQRDSTHRPARRHCPRDHHGSIYLGLNIAQSYYSFGVGFQRNFHVPSPSKKTLKCWLLVYSGGVETTNSTSLALENALLRSFYWKWWRTGPFCGIPVHVFDAGILVRNELTAFPASSVGLKTQFSFYMKGSDAAFFGTTIGLKSYFPLNYPGENQPYLAGYFLLRFRVSPVPRGCF